MLREISQSLGISLIAKATRDDENSFGEMIDQPQEREHQTLLSFGLDDSRQV